MDAILAPSPASPKSDTTDIVDNPNLTFGFGGGARRAVGAGVEPTWPVVDVILGNPPFLGGNRIRAELGDSYVDRLFKLYEGRVPAFSDLVCYWFEKGRAMIETGKAKRAGLLAAQAIRGGVNRKVLDRIKETGNIFWAHSDRNWFLNGASVHVSMIGFDSGEEKAYYLNNTMVGKINPDLTASIDLTMAKQLQENAMLSFQGPSPKAPFDILEELAEEMLSAPLNPNGRPNSDVIRPVLNAADLGQESRNKWTIDFGLMEQDQAAYYELPFEYVKRYVLPVRLTRRDDYRGKWWQYARPRPEMRRALKDRKRFIATQRHSKHRVFVWVDRNYLCNDATIVFARDDDYFFGILHSMLHEIWARGKGTQVREVESGFKYTPTSTFETFPFPWPPGQEPEDDPRVQAIAQAARELVEQRDRWLNPQTLEVSHQDSAVVKPPKETSEVPPRKRTLTNLYNARPTWLDLAHGRLDQAVFAAYGWSPDLSDEEALEKLLALNLERANKQSA